MHQDKSNAIRELNVRSADAYAIQVISFSCVPHSAGRNYDSNVGTEWSNKDLLKVEPPVSLNREKQKRKIRLDSRVPDVWRATE